MKTIIFAIASIVLGITFAVSVIGFAKTADLYIACEDRDVYDVNEDGVANLKDLSIMAAVINERNQNQ